MIALACAAAVLPVVTLAESATPEPSGAAIAGPSIVEQDVCAYVHGPALTGQQDLLARLMAGTASVILAPCRPEGPPTPAPSPSVSTVPASPLPTADPVGDSWTTVRRTYRRFGVTSTTGPSPTVDYGGFSYLRGLVTGSRMYKGDIETAIATHKDATGRWQDVVYLYQPNFGPGVKHGPQRELRKGDLIEAVVVTDPAVDGVFGGAPAVRAYRVRILRHHR